MYFVTQADHGVYHVLEDEAMGTAPCSTVKVGASPPPRDKVTSNVKGRMPLCSTPSTIAPSPNSFKARATPAATSSSVILPGG